MEKKFLPDFLPPRVVKAKQGWYLEWYEKNPATGQLDRIRKTFSLNRIRSKSQRSLQAQRILVKITQQLLEGGYLYRADGQPKATTYSLDQALDMALKGKLQRASRDTQNSYNSTATIFKHWLQKQGLQRKDPQSFTRRHAIAFLDHCQSVRGVGARAYNNYRTILSSLFGWMKSREMIHQNVWEEIARQKAPDKARREFTATEQAIIAQAIAAQNAGLYLALLLLYYCFIRPTEMRGLRLKDIDLERQLITVPASISKNKKTQRVTIPDVLAEPLRSGLMPQAPDYYFLFGPGLTPHPRRSCGKNAMNYAHRSILEDLQAKELIGDIQGLSFYSWKDTGLTDQAQEAGLLDLMRQARHSDPSITMIYINRARPNERMKKVTGRVLKKPGS
jgi:integrase/recombinase XerD